MVRPKTSSSISIRRRADERFVFMAILGSFWLSLSAGCEGVAGRSEGAGVMMSETVRAPTLLLSEIESAADLARVIDCPIVLDNRGDKGVLLKLLATGCSCYGVEVNGKRIARGESVEVAGNSSLSLNINAQPPLTESSQEYRASFEVLEEAGTRAERHVTCALQVYRDLKAFPKVLVCETTPGGPTSFDRELQLEQIYRSGDGQVDLPVLKGLPSGVELRSLIPQGVPVELESGLWKANWTAALHIEMEDSSLRNERSEPYSIRFDSTGGASTAAELHNRLVRKYRTPVIFPNRVHFGRIPEGKFRKRVIFVSSVDGRHFKLEADALRLPENVTVMISQDAETRFRVEVQLKALVPQDWEAELQLRTNIPEQAEIQVLLQAIFTGSGSD